jgi:hypothetical protein
MAKLIQTIHDRVNLAIRKGQTGYFSPEQIDKEVYTEMLNIWRVYVKEFERARIINTYLNMFIRTEDVTPNPTDGSILLTDAWHYPVAIRVKATGKDVDEVDQGKWDRRINHSIEFPDADNPICKFESKKIWARPIDIGELTVSYIAKPIKPVYAYDVVGDRYVYNDGNSVDVEFDELLHDDIKNRVLGNLGVPMREEFMVRNSEQKKATEGR